MKAAAGVVETEVRWLGRHGSPARVGAVEAARQRDSRRGFPPAGWVRCAARMFLPVRRLAGARRLALLLGGYRSRVVDELGDGIQLCVHGVGCGIELQQLAC